VTSKQNGPDTAQKDNTSLTKDKYLKYTLKNIFSFRSTLGDELNLYILKYGYIKMASIP